MFTLPLCVPSHTCSPSYGDTNSFTNDLKIQKLSLGGKLKIVAIQNRTLQLSCFDA